MPSWLTVLIAVLGAAGPVAVAVVGRTLATRLDRAQERRTEAETVRLLQDEMRALMADQQAYARQQIDDARARAAADTARLSAQLELLRAALAAHVRWSQAAIGALRAAGHTDWPPPPDLPDLHI